MNIARKIIISAVACGGGTAVAAQVYTPPPPPLQSIEILRPTYQSTTVRPLCGAASEISWRFGPEGVTFTKAKLVGISNPDAATKELTARAREITGNVFVRVECDNAATIISLIATDGAVAGKTKQIRFNTKDGKLVVVRRYRFP